jgi:hypothetical protein
MADGHYSRRHDRVLEIIREAVSFLIARTTKGLTTNTRAIGFKGEGASTKTTNKPFSILDKAPDWIILMYRYEKQYRILGNFCLFKKEKACTVN